MLTDNHVLVFSWMWDEHFVGVISDSAIQSGAKTNDLDGMLIGHHANGREVWAHLVRDYGDYHADNVTASTITAPIRVTMSRPDEYFREVPNRALVVFQYMTDESVSRSGHSIRTVISLATLDEVADWHDGTIGQGLSEKYSFIISWMCE